jgi:hypothetical protein
MSDCDKCVHTYRSGNCVLGCDQTFTIIENRVVNSSLEPYCPHFVLSGRVRDSSDSAKDLSDRDTNENIDTDSKPGYKLCTKFEVLRNINLGLFGGCITGAVFFGLNKVPSLDFITFVFCVMFIISAAIYAFDFPEDNDQDPDGDDQ